MKTKKQLTNRILSLVLTFVMVLGMLPMTAYAAADTGAYAPTRRENYFNDDDAIFANGTAITIEAAPNGTRIWYMDGATKKYVTNNGENGEDLSGWDIFVGSDNSDGMSGVNGSVTMTGGTVRYVMAGQNYGYFSGTSNITITGGTVRESIFCNSRAMVSLNDYVQTVTIYDATGAAINTGNSGKADNVVQKKGATWNVSGNPNIPAGVTMTVADGETLTVPAGATLRNNGTLVNNGGTITVYGQLLGNAPENYVAPTDFTVMIGDLQANVPTTGTITAITPADTTLVPQSSIQIVDAGTTGAVADGMTITAYGEGTVAFKVLVQDGYGQPIEEYLTRTVTHIKVTGLSAAVATTDYIGKTINLPTGVSPADASFRTVEWTLIDAGTTNATLNGNQLKAVNAGTVTICATVQNGLGYGKDFTRNFTITFEPVETIDISMGSVTINRKDDANVTVSYEGFDGGTKDYPNNKPIVITGSTSSNSVIVNSGSPTIELNNASIDRSAVDNASAFYIESGASVTVIISGNNTLKSGRNRAGIHVRNNSSLTIEGDGNLTAVSGKYAAGIGEVDTNTPGAITINSGTVNAQATSSGADIGGGYAGSAGNITINGGNIIAQVNGIGSGNSGRGGIVVINGGNIKGDVGGFGVTVQDSNGNSVSKVTLTLNGALTDTAVSSVTGINYGVIGVKTLDTDKLYFYLPSGTAATSITAGGKEYFCASTGLNYRTSHDWSNSDGVCANCGMECAHAGEVDQCSVCGAALHTHQWEYNVSGTAIRAVCKADGCPNDDGGSVTLNVSDAYFTGSEIGATVTGSFTNGATYKLTYNDVSETAPSSIGTHTAKLTVYENGTEKQSVTAQYKISYLPAPNPAYTISGAYEDNGTYWFKSRAVAEVSASEGFMISTTLDGTYGAFVYFDEGDSKTVYLKRVSDGALTDAVNVEGIYFDGNGATGKITIENRGFWEKLFNKITFGLFFKGDAVAKVSAMDDESGWKSIQYYVADEDLINDGDASVLEAAIGNNWKDYSDEIALNKNAKNIIYVKITDNVGNVTYISSEGIVLYSDAEAVTESVSTTYKAGADKDVTVKLNGNTVNAITNGDDVLAGADYSVSADGTITLKASYLDALNAGTYTFTVSYNPLGEAFVGAPSNDAPKTTTFKVVVEKADGKVSNINISGKTYDGTAVTAPTFDKLGDGEATIEYKIKGAEDSTYTTTAPKNAGDYIVRVTVAEGTNYKAASATAEFTIDKVAITVTADAKIKVYGESDPALTWSITNGALINGEQLTGIIISRVSGENANTYAITVSQAEGANKNYDITFVGGTFTINAKTVDATVVVNGAPFTYNGSKQEPEIVVKDGDTVIPANEYEVSYSSNTNAGTATVIVTDKDGGNYVVNGTATFIINKANPVIGTVSVDGVVKDSTKPSEVVLTRTDTTVDGVLKLADDAMLTNKSDYRWVFTPTDTGNYNVINGDVQIDVLDTVPPTAVIKVDTNDWKQFINNITFGLFFKETQEVTITATDNENGSGIKELVYFVSDCEYEADELRYVEWKTYTEAFDIEPDGKFVIYAKVTDNDGNAVVINSDGVVLDKTAAVVSGITDGETYYGQLVFTATDELAGVKSVVIDGNDKTHFEGQYVINGDNAEHTVTVTDNAGNVTEYKVTVYKNYNVTFTADGEPVSTETVGHGKDANLPAVPAKEGFVGKWDHDGKNIAGDTTISVVYTEIPVVKPDEVKPEDKADLVDIKEKLEEELKDDSYTEDDKKDIQDAIDDIDEALEVIGNVEAAEELIDKLPDTIKKDDEAAIKAADDAYNALSDYEKSLVDEDAKKALDDAKAALAELNKPADPNSPATGDNSNMFLWIVFLFISGGAVITLTVVDRKRKAVKR